MGGLGRLGRLGSGEDSEVKYDDVVLGVEERTHELQASWWGIVGEVERTAHEAQDSNAREMKMRSSDVVCWGNLDVVEAMNCCWIRPYCAESTASHPNSEVKLRQAVLVLGWATTRESTVPYPFYLLHVHTHCCFPNKRSSQATSLLATTHQKSIDEQKGLLDLYLLRYPHNNNKYISSTPTSCIN